QPGNDGLQSPEAGLSGLPLYGQGLANRVIAGAQEQGADFRSGALEHTGRNLDVAVDGSGWIVVQSADGSPALTRNGALAVSPMGIVQTNDGHPVLGQGFAP